MLYMREEEERSEPDRERGRKQNTACLRKRTEPESSKPQPSGPLLGFTSLLLLASRGRLDAVVIVEPVADAARQH